MMAATWNDAVSVVGDAPHRKVVANKPLPKGTILLKELPTLTILHKNQWGTRCNQCFFNPPSSSGGTPQKKLLRCSQCKLFYYCCKECQRNDWNNHHKQECQALAARNNHHVKMSHGDHETEVLLADALLVARVFGLQETNPQQFRAVMDLVFHEECIEPDHHYSIAKLVRSLGLLSPPKKKVKNNDDDKTETTLTPTTSDAISDRDIVEMLARFDANNFGIVDDLLFLFGTGIYPQGAMLNHACDHNCAISYQFKTSQQIIKTIVDVEQGEELCHPYVDFASTSVQRRQKLQTTYGFDCQCSRCLNQDGSWAQIDEWLTGRIADGGDDHDEVYANLTISMSEQMLQQAALTDDMEQELHLVQQCVALRAKELHPRHLALYQARSQLHTTAMAAGEMSVARDQCVEIVKTMETCFYRPEHPLVGIMQYTLGSLHHSLGEHPQAIKCYQKALPILECYHGRDHCMTEGCKGYLQQAREEAEATASGSVS